MSGSSLNKCRFFEICPAVVQAAASGVAGLERAQEHVMSGALMDSGCGRSLGLVPLCLNL